MQYEAGQDFRQPPDWDAGFEFRGGSYAAGDAGVFSTLIDLEDRSAPWLANP